MKVCPDKNNHKMEKSARLQQQKLIQSFFFLNDMILIHNITKSKAYHHFIKKKDGLKERCLSKISPAYTC